MPLHSSQHLPPLNSPLPFIFTIFPPAASHATTFLSKPIPAESMQTMSKAIAMPIDLFLKSVKTSLAK
ncbi:hypothetical protein C0995_004087, partial [Termitomyces sp. Mi166